MRKQFISYAACFLIGALGLTGCDSLLEENPPSSQRLNDFYQNEDEARVALNGVYSALWQEGMYRDGEMPVTLVELSGDILEEFTGEDEQRPFDDYAWTSSDRLFQSFWTSSYLGINRANTLIARIAGAQIDDAAKQNLVGQAKFLRAFFYFNLVRSFGEVPLYTEPVTSAEQAEAPRSSVEEVYAQIVDDLQSADESLSPYQPPEEPGQATAGSARALLAKVYLQQRNWQQAADMAEGVINMDVYGLFDDFADAFDQEDENGVEHIFSVQYLDNQGSSTLAENHLPREFGPENTSLPNGTRIRFALNRELNQLWSYEMEYFEDMPNSYRRWMSVRDRMPFYFEVATRALVTDTVDIEAPSGMKFYDVNPSTGTMRTGVNFPVLRYADVLLMYAEALNEVNGGPTAAAYDAINQVRGRARAENAEVEYDQDEDVLPDLEGLDQDAFRKAVLRERGLELSGEGHRRWDLIRHDLLIERNADKGAEPYQRLFPIPATEVSRNPNLEQNPGY